MKSFMFFPSIRVDFHCCVIKLLDWKNYLIVEINPH